MTDEARALGLAAQFVSEYLVISLDDRDGVTSLPTHGAIHAWAQIHLPSVRWIDVDPTHGSVGKRNLVTVAVVCDPEDAVSLHGTYMGPLRIILEWM